jgi:hypothetical protein
VASYLPAVAVCWREITFLGEMCRIAPFVAILVEQDLGQIGVIENFSPRPIRCLSAAAIIPS